MSLNYSKYSIEPTSTNPMEWCYYSSLPAAAIDRT